MIDLVEIVAWLTQVYREDVARLSEPTFCGSVWPTTEQLLVQIQTDLQIIKTCAKDADVVWHTGYTCGAENGYIEILMQFATRHADRPGFKEEWRA